MPLSYLFTIWPAE